MDAHSEITVLKVDPRTLDLITSTDNDVIEVRGVEGKMKEESSH